MSDELNFLFCEKCNIHVEEYLLAKPTIMKQINDHTFEVKLKPVCTKCGNILIKKWVEVTVEVSL